MEILVSICALGPWPVAEEVLSMGIGVGNATRMLERKAPSMELDVRPEVQFFRLG